MTTLTRLGAVRSGLLMMSFVLLSEALLAVRLNQAAASVVRLGIRICHPECRSTLYGHLASIHERMERFDEAINNLNQLIQQQPNDAFLYFELGAVYEKKGQPEFALANFERCLNMDKGAPEDFRAALRTRIQQVKRSIGSET